MDDTPAVGGVTSSGFGVGLLSGPVRGERQLLGALAVARQGHPDEIPAEQAERDADDQRQVGPIVVRDVVQDEVKHAAGHQAEQTAEKSTPEAHAAIVTARTGDVDSDGQIVDLPRARRARLLRAICPGRLITQDEQLATVERMLSSAPERHYHLARGGCRA